MGGKPIKETERSRALQNGARVRGKRMLEYMRGEVEHKQVVGKIIF